MALHKGPATVNFGIKEVSTFGGTLLPRALGSLIVVAIIVGGIMLGGWVWAIAASFIALGSLWEFYQLLSSKFKISKAWGLLGGLAILILVSTSFSYALIISIIALVAFLVLFTEVVRRQSTGDSYALMNLGGTLAGVIYIIMPWSFMIAVRSQTWGHVFLFTIFACTWSCDVFSYLAGTKFGSSKFCVNVSPNKSWEGFWAGLMASTLCGVGLAFFFDFPPIPLLLLGILCGTAGQLGDLGESVLKREANVKDSGSIIPGHGGFLDRFDSILLNATLAFFIFEAIG